MEMKQETLEKIKYQMKRVKAAGGFYAKRLKHIDPDDINSQEDFEKLPFSEKADLRDAYPLGLSAGSRCRRPGRSGRKARIRCKAPGR